MLRFPETDSVLDFLARCEALWKRFNYSLCVAKMIYSRAQPHYNLKKFLSPAFTVAYVDKLDHFFCKSIQHLICKFEGMLGPEGSPAGKKAVMTDMMDDLHNVALDM
jgi:hypothetical protein